ncbi:DUF7662 domain-containing protein [Nocardioides humi]|uniref:DUF7662 domain-containing protein n=1 Tax=Nocardioides humi TaxID=449461 RepID=A0ABN2AWD1_9ACTN|nr:hypothetical protein [Nocardioides humi]
MEDAPELNRELTRLLCEAGELFGFGVQREYAVPGGRIDVVWVVDVPIWSQPLPVIGFEVESSWRTRKHVKGDLLNLTDAGVSLGVIVLAGESEKDVGLRKFAQTLVDRPGPPVVIWTREDVYALAARSSSPALPAGALSWAGDPDGGRVPSASGAGPTVMHAGKYAPLWRWLKRQDAGEVFATFAEVEAVLGFALPNSSMVHVAHWHSYEGSAVARAIIDAGWKASQVDLTGRTVVFHRA